jgi:hypothetical protein
VQRSATIDVQSDAKLLYLQLAMLNATGQVDFDDIVVTPQTTAAPKSATPASPTSPVPAGATVAGAEAIINGNMEAADAGDGLAGWFILERLKPQAQVITENGNRFLRLTNSDPAHSVIAEQTIKVEPSWKAVTVSARIRATNFKIGKTTSQDARAAFVFRDASGQRLGGWPQVPRVLKDGPWITKTVTVDIPPGTKTIYVQVAMFNSTGQVDFDDVSVVPQVEK